MLVERGRFVIKLAETEDELAMAQQLRYRIFHDELGKLHGSAGSDSDAFDRQFNHLLVIDREADRLAGTYRMQSAEAARNGLGFYSETEFEIDNFDRIDAETYEVGRSCVAPEYRNGAAISLLWAGLHEMKNRCNFRYLVGCASVESESPEVGWSLFDQFRANGQLSPLIHGRSRGDFQLPRLGSAEPPPLPPLFKGYLRLGALIASEPALDRDFGCIDFLILFDFEEMTARYSRHYNGKSN